MQVQGTTNTGTEVQVRQERTDNELHEAFVNALTAAEAAAGKFITSISGLAVSILDLHQSGAWQRVVDENGKQVFQSASAYYRHVASVEKFPKLHKTLRVELVQELFELGTTPDGDMLIGVRELAALVNTDPAQVTRTAREEKAKREALAAEAAAKAKAEAAAEAAAAAAADAAAAAAAEAEAAGKSKAEAEAAADAAAAAVAAFATAAAKAEAEAEAEAAAKAEADAAAKERDRQIKRAKTALENALQLVSDVRPDMGAEDRAWALKLVTEAGKAFRAWDTLNAPKPQPEPKPKPEPKPRRAASA